MLSSMQIELERDILKFSALYMAAAKMKGNEFRAFKLHKGRLSELLGGLSKWDSLNIGQQGAMLDEYNELMDLTEKMLNSLPLREN
jgi:hypothetical protein